MVFWDLNKKRKKSLCFIFNLWRKNKENVFLKSYTEISSMLLNLHLYDLQKKCFYVLTFFFLHFPFKILSGNDF